MRVRLRRRGIFGVREIVAGGNIEKIEKNPDKDGIGVLFCGHMGLGIIEFGEVEVNKLRKELVGKKRKIRKNDVI